MSLHETTENGGRQCQRGGGGGGGAAHYPENSKFAHWEHRQIGMPIKSGMETVVSESRVHCPTHSPRGVDPVYNGHINQGVTSKGDRLARTGILFALALLGPRFTHDLLIITT